MKKTLENKKKFFGNGLVELVFWEAHFYQDTYKLNAIPIKIPISLLLEMGGKSCSTIIWNHKRPKIANTILSRKNNDIEITILGVVIL